ncbi:hypothetical protein ACD578_01380 [Microvirga sp. RSM25]
MRRIVAGLMTLLLSTSAALAQASPPVEGAPPTRPALQMAPGMLGG